MGLPTRAPGTAIAVTTPHWRESAPRFPWTRRGFAAAGLELGLGFSPACLAAERAYATDEPAAASSAASQVKTWVLETADNQGLPFMIVDKVNAQVFAFDREGVLLGTAPVLLGLSPGDVSPPGIGDSPLSGIAPEDRITPAGRFIASMGENLGGKGILWIDYDTALSLHPVITARASDRRFQRLASATALDNRISYGCINVPVTFFENVVEPAFDGTVGVVYILPETRSIEHVFFTAATAAADAK